MFSVLEEESEYQPESEEDSSVEGNKIIISCLFLDSPESFNWLFAISLHMSCFVHYEFLK